MLKVVKTSEIESVIGTEVGVSDWVIIDQERIDKFAEATMDHQFIHVDPEKAAPIFGSTIAHGALMLSLSIGKGYETAIVVEGTKMAMNYGYDKIRFINPVPVDSNCRYNSTLLEVTDKGNGRWLMKTKIELEVEGSDKPGFVAENLAMVFV